LKARKIILVIFILSILASSFIFQSIFSELFASQEKYKPPDIFVVIANGTDDPDLKGWQIAGMLIFYKFFRDLGIDDDHIELLLYHPHYPDFIHTECYEEFFSKSKWYRPYLYHKEEEVVIDEERVTKKKFLKAIRNINSTKNDYVYVYFASHGSRKGKVVFQNEEYLTSKDLVKVLRRIKYKRLFVFQETCYASRLACTLIRFKNCIAIASSHKFKKGAAGILPMYLIPKIVKNPKLSIDKIIKMTNDLLFRRQHPTLITYYSDKKLGNELFLPDYYIPRLSSKK